MVFLIIIPIDYLIYVAVWAGAFLVTAISINGIDLDNKNRVILRFLVLLAPILIAITLVLLAFFVGLIDNFISKKLKSSRPYFFVCLRLRFAGSKIFFRLGLRCNNIY